jgi:hypothetical protein
MVARLALHCVLKILGMAMDLASRVSSRYRAALSRDRIIAIESKDGAAFHFVFHNRRVNGLLGRPAQADFTLRFTTSSQALGVLLSPRVVGKILNGILEGTVEHQGNLVLLLWFDGRVQQVAPLREPIRWPARFPGAYVKPRQDLAAAHLITREPAKPVLDADWAAAWKQRKKLLMMRVAAGEPHSEI